MTPASSTDREDIYHIYLLNVLHVYVTNILGGHSCPDWRSNAVNKSNAFSLATG